MIECRRRYVIHTTLLVMGRKKIRQQHNTSLPPTPVTATSPPPDTPSVPPLRRPRDFLRFSRFSLPWFSLVLPFSRGAFYYEINRPVRARIGRWRTPWRAFPTPDAVVVRPVRLSSPRWRLFYEPGRRPRSRPTDRASVTLRKNIYAGVYVFAKRFRIYQKTLEFCRLREASNFAWRMQKTISSGQTIIRKVFELYRMAGQRRRTLDGTCADSKIGTKKEIEFDEKKLSMDQSRHWL